MADPEDAPPAPEDAVLDDVPPLDFDLRVALDSIPFRAGGVVVEPEVPALLRGDAGRLRWLLSALAGGRPSATLAVALEEESRSGFLLYFAVRGEGTAPLPAEPGRRTLLEEAARRLGGRLGNGAFFTAWLGRPAGPPDPPPLAPLHGLPLLLSGGDLPARRALAMPLEAAGARVETTEDGPAAGGALGAAGWGARPVALVCATPEDATSGATRQQPFPEPPAGLRAVLLAPRGRRGDARRAQEAGFAAYLPLPVPDALLVEAVASVAAAHPSPGLVTRFTVAEARKRRVRLLVVEGNASRRLITAGLLENLGYRVRTAADGDEAVAALGTGRHDLVFLDVATRGVFGLDAVRRIRAGEGGVTDPAVPVVGLTSPERIEARGHALAAGMDDVAVKPLRQDQLAALVLRWVPGAAPFSRA